MLLFENGTQGVGLAAIVGGGAGAYADEREGAFFANLGSSLALGDFVDELAVAQSPAARVGVGGKGHDALVAFVVFFFSLVVLAWYVLHGVYLVLNAAAGVRGCGLLHIEIMTKNRSWCQYAASFYVRCAIRAGFSPASSIVG
jgi:hypothetical protein